MRQDKMREAFEEWALQNDHPICRRKHDGMKEPEYSVGVIEYAWRGWQAALATRPAGVDVEALFPPHKAGLYLTHNQHKDYYETVQEYTERDLENPHGQWVSDEQKQKSHETQELWELQVYPETPISFYCYWGADLIAVLRAANPNLTQQQPNNAVYINRVLLNALKFYNADYVEVKKYIEVDGMTDMEIIHDNGEVARNAIELAKNQQSTQRTKRKAKQ